MSFLMVDKQGHTLYLTLADPARRNALTSQLRGELISGLEQANVDPEVRVIILKGAGGTFCSGGDLGAMPPPDREEARSRLKQVEVLIRLLACSPKVTIAVVDGPAVGLGASLAIACDYVFMSSRAVFIFPFTSLGLMPDGGMLHTLGLRTGYGTAKRILLEARAVEAEEALRIGLVDFVLPLQDLDAAADSKADLLASRAPLAIAAIKAASGSGPPDMDQVFAAEQREQQKLYFSSDFAAGKAAFEQRRTAVFTGS